LALAIHDNEFSRCLPGSDPVCAGRNYFRRAKACARIWEGLCRLQIDYTDVAASFRMEWNKKKLQLVLIPRLFVLILALCEKV
jgi:hypothetical protein